jgi:hypothetical protein
MITCNKEFLDVVFANLNIDILGTPLVHRGGRKMNKAGYRAMCVKVAKATTFIRVDKLEVDKDRLSYEELAQKLTINNNEIVKVLFKKGIATIVNQTLDYKNCQSYLPRVLGRNHGGW